MKDMIEALTIILKYGERPTHIAAEHDIIYVGGAVQPEDMDPADVARLDELGFHVDEENGSGFYTFV